MTVPIALPTYNGHIEIGPILTFFAVPWHNGALITNGFYFVFELFVAVGNGGTTVPETAIMGVAGGRKRTSRKFAGVLRDYYPADKGYSLNLKWATAVCLVLV